MVDEFKLAQKPVRGSRIEAIEKNFSFMFIFDPVLVDEIVQPIVQNVRRLLDAGFLAMCFIIMGLLIGIVLYVVSQVADMTTRPIVELHGRILVVLDSVREKGQDGNFNLMYNYVERSKEINELYLAISKTTKVLQFASQSVFEGDDQTAFLKYHEVA